MKVKKLVRDNIPGIMKRAGKNPVFYVADEKQFNHFVREKLLEEVHEFLESDSVEELADVLEVIYAICDAKNIKREDLEKARIKKVKERGVFKKRFISEIP
jgi:predicted house-cleaning noncanonical NTP pyrophosphatase (MazG superfamily)